MELGMIKICLAALWLPAGAYFHQYVENYFFPLLTVFFLTAVGTGYLWLKKMKESK